MTELPTRFWIDDLLVDRAQHSVSRGGEPIPLGKTTFRLLVYLAEIAPAVACTDDLLAAVWAGRVVAPETVAQRIRLLRRALGDRAREPRYVRGVRGVGYQLKATVTAAPPVSSAARGTSPLITASAAPEDWPVPDAPSIAVLPFRDESGQAEAHALLRAVQQELTTRLGRTRAFFVTARASAARYPSLAQDAATAGRALSVRYLLEGSFRCDGTRIDADLFLTDALQRRELWSERVTLTASQMQDAEVRIAEQVVGAVTAETGRNERGRAVRLPREALSAWTAYHRGTHFMYRFDDASLREAEWSFRRSLELDPMGARSHAGLSWVCWQQAFLGTARDPALARERTLSAARSSVELAPDDPLARWAQGRAELLQGNLDAALSDLEAVRSLNPSFAVGRYSLAFAQLQNGDLDAARENAAESLRLSPYDPLRFLMLGALGFAQCLGPEAEQGAELLLAATREPNAHHEIYSKAAVGCALAGRLADARRLMERVHELVPAYDAARFFQSFRYRQSVHRDQITEAFHSLAISLP
ncbi:MAG: winged helix-turn-helix domain-containing protein [Pseudomonadota bacterium]